MKRRAFVGGMAAVMAAHAVEAQRAENTRRVGLIFAWPSVRHDPARDHPLFVALDERLRALGYAEHQNLVFAVRAGPAERLAALASELVDLNVEVIVAWGTPGTAAAKRATTSIPIVTASGDAMGTGLISNLARPAGNVTGVSWHHRELIGKQCQFLRELVPTASRIGVLFDSADPIAASVRAGLDDVVRAMNLHLRLVEAVTTADLDGAFATLRQARVGGVLVTSGHRYFNQPREVASAALAHRLPTVFGEPAAVRVGGLLAYSVDWPEMSRQAANYVDRILRGAKPGDLPVEQPTKYMLVVNLKTAHVLGLTIPQSLLLRADEVIQ